MLSSSMVSQHPSREPVHPVVGYWPGGWKPFKRLMSRDSSATPCVIAEKIMILRVAQPMLGLWVIPELLIAEATQEESE